MQTSSHLTVAESLRFNRTASGLRSMTLALHFCCHLRGFQVIPSSVIKMANQCESSAEIESCSGIFYFGFSMALIFQASLKNPTPQVRGAECGTFLPSISRSQGAMPQEAIKSWWDIDVKFTSEPFRNPSVTRYVVSGFQKIYRWLGNEQTDRNETL